MRDAVRLGDGEKEEQSEEKKSKINLGAEDGLCVQHKELVSVTATEENARGKERCKAELQVVRFYFYDLPIISQIFLVLPLAQHLSTAEKLA